MSGLLDSLCAERFRRVLLQPSMMNPEIGWRSSWCKIFLRVRSFVNTNVRVDQALARHVEEHDEGARKIAKYSHHEAGQNQRQSCQAVWSDHRRIKNATIKKIWRWTRMMTDESDAGVTYKCTDKRIRLAMISKKTEAAQPRKGGQVHKD